MNQSTHTVLMVAPTTFAFNEETASSNHFQHHAAAGEVTVQHTAQAEFDQAVASLRQAGIRVLVHKASAGLPAPDAVFPNNWLTTWPDGTVYTYPMAAENRRRERASGVVERLQKDFAVSKVVDLSASENEQRFLEATGAMVFDHQAKVVYGCLANRCDHEMLRTHAKAIGYRPVVFHAFGPDAAPVYHTNVMVSIHSTTAIACLQAITDVAERAMVRDSLESSGHQIIDIDFVQMTAFCANTLEVRGHNDQLYLVLSQGAAAHFSDMQRELLQTDKKILPIAVPTIEQVGGGGIRCMLAEVFLPSKSV